MAACEAQVTYRVYFKVPWLTGLVEIDDDLFVLQPELLDHDVCAVSPRAAVVGVECDLVASHDDVGYESESYGVGVSND